MAARRGAHQPVPGGARLRRPDHHRRTGRFRRGPRRGGADVRTGKGRSGPPTGRDQPYPRQAAHRHRLSPTPAPHRLTTLRDPQREPAPYRRSHTPRDTATTPRPSGTSPKFTPIYQVNIALETMQSALPSPMVHGRVGGMEDTLVVARREVLRPGRRTTNGATRHYRVVAGHPADVRGPCLVGPPTVRASWRGDAFDELHATGHPSRPRRGPVRRRLSGRKGQGASSVVPAGERAGPDSAAEPVRARRSRSTPFRKVAETSLGSKRSRPPWRRP